MADIKQIKVEGVSYDLNSKYIQDGSGNGKTWSDITDLINAGVQLVTDAARKEAAADGGVGMPATTAAAGTMGKIYMVAGDGAMSGSYVEFITVDKGTGKDVTTRYIWEKIGTTETDLSNYAKKKNIALSGTAATAGATSTGSAGADAAFYAAAVTAAGAVTYTAPKLSGALPTFGTSTVAVATGATAKAEYNGEATFTGTGAVLGTTIATETVAATVTQPVFTAAFTGTKKSVTPTVATTEDAQAPNGTITVATETITPVVTKKTSTVTVQ